MSIPQMEKQTCGSPFCTVIQGISTCTELYCISIVAQYFWTANLEGLPAEVTLCQIVGIIGSQEM